MGYDAPAQIWALGGTDLVVDQMISWSTFHCRNHEQKTDTAAVKGPSKPILSGGATATLAALTKNF